MLPDGTSPALRRLWLVFASFMQTVPPAVRLLLAIGITVGVTLVLVRLTHRRLVELSAKDHEAKQVRDERVEAGETDVPPLPPESYNLANRVLGLTSTGFVFLLAFTLGNFWGTSADARSATQTEIADWARAYSLSRSLEGSEPLTVALEEYRASVVEEQWRLLQEADGVAASKLQREVSQRVSDAVFALEPSEQQTPQWTQITAAVDDMLDQARDRIDAVPNPAAPGVIALIFVLGVTNLAMAAVFQPARLGPNLFLMGLMASITAVMLFVLVEAANPYVGAVAVSPSGF